MILKRWLLLWPDVIKDNWLLAVVDAMLIDNMDYSGVKAR